MRPQRVKHELVAAITIGDDAGRAAHPDRRANHMTDKPAPRRTDPCRARRPEARVLPVFELPGRRRDPHRQRQDLSGRQRRKCLVRPDDLCRARRGRRRRSRPAIASSPPSPSSAAAACRPAARAGSSWPSSIRTLRIVMVDSEQQDHGYQSTLDDSCRAGSTRASSMR